MSFQPGDKVTVRNGKRVYTVAYAYSAATTALWLAGGNIEKVPTHDLRPALA